MFSSKKINTNILIIWVSIWISSIIFSFKNWPKNWCSHKYDCNKNECQLYWPWYKGVGLIHYSLLVFILPIIYSDVKNKLFWLLYSIISPMVIHKFYPNTQPSIWCFIGPIITSIIQIFNIPDKIFYSHLYLKVHI